MKQDCKTIMYIIDYERVDGVLNIAGITRSVGQGLDFKNGYAKMPVGKAEAPVSFAEILALNELMLFKGKKAKRTREREGWDETLEWMQNLPLDTRVEL